MDRYNISFAGAGRVGSAICSELFKAGFKIDMVVTRNEKSGSYLARSCNAEWSSNLDFPGTTDIIIVAVPDHQLHLVLDNLKCNPGALVAHTAGSYGLDIFPENFLNKGIIYPLQTFSTGRKVTFTDLPFFIESSDQRSAAMLENIVLSVGGKVYETDTESRKLMHLSAVFACNFTNHMLTAGKSIAVKAGFSFDILLPLINETISKAILMSPENSQTGPAIRNDSNTMEKHMELLSFSPELKTVYRDITESIIKYYKK